MRPRGRPPYTRGVFALEETGLVVPTQAGVDTSFVVEALLASQPRHRVSADFLTRMAEAGTEIVFSRLLELELREAVFQIALKERHPKDWKRFRSDGRARPRAARLMESVCEAWEEALESFVWTDVEVGDVLAQANRLMSQYGVASYDAVHAATAIAHARGVIVTLDAGFGAIPQRELELYIDRSRVSGARSRRA